MNRKHTLSPFTLKSILVASQDILRYTKKIHRYHTQLHNSSLLSENIYEQAKKAQTQQRNLPKAAFLYADAACQGIRLDSCIKDFASILHQMGETFEAVQFLLEVRPYYGGDLKKFDRLLNTLQRQLKPSKKHQCKALLFEFPSQEFVYQDILSQLFQNVSRVKKAKFYRKLDFSQEHTKGKWMVLQFQSFSAAKKTLQKFNEQQWFMVNKFWLRGDSIICEAKDGWEDFEQGLILTEEILKQGLCEKYQNLKWDQVSNNRELLNYLAIRLIQEDEHFRSQKARAQESSCRSRKFKAL